MSANIHVYMYVLYMCIANQFLLKLLIFLCLFFLCSCLFLFQRHALETRRRGGREGERGGKLHMNQTCTCVYTMYMYMYMYSGV